MDSSIGAVDDSTAKHLPECIASDPDVLSGSFWCMCSRLRACEQRVLENVRERVMRLPYEIDHQITIDRDEVLGWIDKLRGNND